VNTEIYPPPFLKVAGKLPSSESETEEKENPFDKQDDAGDIESS
jgi:hypothetical protein